MHYSDGGCWAARGRVAQQAAADWPSARRDDSGARAKQPEHGGGAVRLGGGGAGSDGAEVSLLRLGRAE
jgi:hypothetical protein